MQQYSNWKLQFRIKKEKKRKKKTLKKKLKVKRKKKCIKVTPVPALTPTPSSRFTDTLSGMRTIQPKIQEISEEKLSGRKILIDKFSKIWIYNASSSSFREFRKILFLSSPKISGNSKSCFWSNGKAPRATRCLCIITRLGLDLGHCLQANQTHFHMKVFERGLVLKQRRKDP